MRGTTNMSHRSSTATGRYLVAGMTCHHCELAVTEEVNRVPGVEAVEVDLDTGLVTVQGKGLLDDDIRSAIAEAGYEAAPV
jgi:copper chaperone